MHEDTIVVGGLGVVGTATMRALGITSYYDQQVTETHIIPLSNGISIANARYVFLCLPTPTVNGECDISAIRRYIQDNGPGPTYILRSTVPPGTADALMKEFMGVFIVSNPEFLTMATADQDALHPDLLVLGAPAGWMLNDVWERFYRGVDAKRIIFTDNRTAEFIKCAINTFYATKVLFATALYDVAESEGIDYDVVCDAMYARKWIGGNHLKVPWKGRRGVGGNCLPKDLEAFATFSHSGFFRYMHNMNMLHRGEGHDAA